MTQINSSNVTPITAQQNINKTQSDGGEISLTQAKEDTLVAMSDKLQRIRELVVQAANATASNAERLALQSEVNQLIAEIKQSTEEDNISTVID